MTQRISLILLLILSGTAMAQERANQVPSYTHLFHEDLPTVFVDLATFSVNTEDLTIAVATDPQGTVYTLSFGKGVDKRDEDGNLINADFINGLKSPMDIAIDRNGLIYIADFEASGETFEDNGQIKIYDQQGKYVRSILTSYFRPLGIDVNEDYIYIAEYNDGKQGPEKTPSSRVRKVSKETGAVVSVNNNIPVPYRIAVNSKGQVYVSKAGNGSAVLILSEDLIVQGQLADIQSPGSVVVDVFDYVHVNEYSGRIDFSQFINFTSLSSGEIQDIAKAIDKGIDDEAFGIKVFDPSLTLKYFYKEMIDFPVDIAFNGCDRMYVANGDMFGRNSWLFGYIPEKMEFDLEIYQRTPSADVTPPVASCISDFTVDLATGGTRTITGEDLNDGSFDFCDNITLRLSKSTFTAADEGVNIVDLIVTDGQGLSSTCQVTVQVNVENTTDTTDPVFTFCENQEFPSSAGECGAMVNYSIPTATDDSGSVDVRRTEGPAPGDFFPVGPTTVIYTATDGAGNTSECSFTITVLDDEDPVITCPENIEETVAPGVTGIVIQYSPPIYSDNCSVPNFNQTEGLPSGSEFPVGETITNTFVVTDASGKTATCSFTVTLTEALDEEDPVINCPADIQILTDGGECGAIVEYEFPTATDNSGDTTISIINDAPASGGFFPVGETQVVFEARDEAGNSATCILLVTVKDNEPPVMECPEDIFETLAPGETTKVVNFSTPLATDNCSASVVQTTGPTSGSEFPVGEHIITFVASDPSGTSKPCSFKVTVEDPDVRSVSCNNVTLFLNSEGIATLNPEDVFNGDPDDPAIQDLNVDRGQFDCDDLGEQQVKLIVTFSDGSKSDCTAKVMVEDDIIPEGPCPPDVTEVFVASDGFVVPDYRDFSSYSDNCNFTLIQDPAPGTVIFDSKIVEVKAKDGAENHQVCYFNLLLVEEGDLGIICPDNQQVNLQGACETVLLNYTDLVSATEGATVTQSPAAGTVITKNTEVVFTAELDGATETCSFFVLLNNQAELLISCLQDHTVDPDANGNFVIPNYTNQINVNGNCGALDVVQDPPAGTVVNENTLITLTATDDIGNIDDCTFTVNLISQEPDPLTITCPEDQTLNLGDNCELGISDFTGLAAANYPDAVITQSPPAGTIITENTTITLTATLGAETTSCSFELNIQVNDNVDPVASCVPAFTLYLNEEGYGLLSADIIDDGSSDNCSAVQMTLSKTRFENSDIGENPVTLTVTDAAGNTASCETVVTVVAYEGIQVDCPGDVTVSLKDDGEYELILTYSGEAENIEIEVSKSRFTCDDIGTQLVTATYLGEYTGSCDILVTVIDDIPPVLNCVEEIDLRLNASGTASLATEDLELNSSDNCGITRSSLSKSNFTSADIGMQQVILTVTDDSGNSSTCNVTVNVLPNQEVEPVKCVDRLLVSIGANGKATLNPRDLFTGGSGTAQFTVSKDTFSCNDLGENTVTLNYSTPTEEGSCEITVIVEDPENNCEVPTEPAGDYIILYPNPSGGLVRFQTSPGLNIMYIEVFDMRGRFIFEKSFEGENNFNYRLDLRQYQSGVYSLLIHTNGKEFLKRAIIRNE